MWKEVVVVNLCHYSNIFLEQRGKDSENLKHHSQPPGQDLNQGPPSYEAGLIGFSIVNAQERSKRTTLLNCYVHRFLTLRRRTMRRVVTRCSSVFRNRYAVIR
jgi:hypothetical protein